jgi:predicted dehydrogenase
MMEIAVIGVGKVAQDNYIPTLLRHKDVSLTCYSRTSERTEAVAEKFGIRSARTLDELFERKPEVVFNLTHVEQHLESTRSLLSFKPKRLFLEKPLVAKNGQAHVMQEDFWDGKKLLLEAQGAGAETAMVFNYRFFDQIQRAKRLIEERSLGEVISVVALTHFACWSHSIDLIMYFAGPIREICAQQGSRPYPFEDAETIDVTASFVTDKQATGSLLGTSGLHLNFPLFELTVNFERGRIHFRDLDQDMEVLDYNGNVRELFSQVRHESGWTKYNESFEKSVDAYLTSVREGAPPPVPGIAGLLELQVEASLKRSIAERRPVLPAEEFPIDPVR